MQSSLRPQASLIPPWLLQTFFVDQEVADRTKLDAIVTIVDAVHLELQLDEHHEAEEQIALADVVLLNKRSSRSSDFDRGSSPKKLIRTKIQRAADELRPPLDEIHDAFSLDRIRI